MFKPKVVKRDADGRLIVHTRFSQLTGRAPLLVAGMTPTTSHSGVRLVAAAANAGYHVELAAGVRVGYSFQPQGSALLLLLLCERVCVYVVVCVNVC